MQLCALFWFYKDLETCRDRLLALRAVDPEVRIYGLYGGPLEKADEARQKLGTLLDDFWAFPEEKEPKWKWRNGDLMIARWFKDRGHVLQWDTIFVMQWDMVVVAPLYRLFHMLKLGEILLSSLRPMSEVASTWWWAKGTDKAVAQDLLDFRRVLHEKYGYTEELMACLFVVACLPRKFLEKYSESGPPTAGFMEYKLPTMAKVFGIPMCTEHPFLADGWEPSLGRKGLGASGIFLNAIGYEPPVSRILQEVSRSDGVRLFHPVRSKVTPDMLNPRKVRLLHKVMILKEDVARMKSRVVKLFLSWR